MMPKNMRWGYDGGGFTGSHTKGSTYVVIRVAEENVKNIYVLMS